MDAVYPDSMLSAQPPCDLTAERSVLGACMQDANAAGLAFELLTPEDFYAEEHKEIFSAIKAVNAAGNSIDFITVSSELSRRGTLEGVGGAAFLVGTVRYVPTTVNMRSYINIVSEKSTLRKLINASREIQQQCFSQSDELQDVLHHAEKLVFDIVMKRTGTNTLMPIQDVLMSTLGQIEELNRLQGRIGGVPTGLYDLDRMLTGLQPGQLVIVGARPAMGKTSMALGITQFAARKTGCKVAVFSLEMPREQIVMRLLTNDSNVYLSKIRNGMLTDEDWIKLGDSMNALANCNIYIDDTPGLTPTQLRSRCRRLMMEHGLDLIVIDYLGLMTTDGHAESRQLEVSEISRSLKAIALELKIPIIACAQLSRANAARQDKRPILSDLRESGSIEQDADIVLFLHREAYYASEADKDNKPDENEGEIIIAKQRNGGVGTVNVEWQGDFARYANKPGTLVARYLNEVE